MGAVQSNINKQSQSLTNSIYQTSRVSCEAQCNNTVKDISIILVNSQMGNLTIDQECTITTTCALASSLETNVEATMKSMVQQSNQTSNGFPDFNINGNLSYSETKQTVLNNIIQMMDSSCSFHAENLIEDVMVYGLNSKVGDIAISQKSQVAGDCAINNIAKATVKTEQEATTQQKNTVITTGALFMTVIALAVGGGIIITAMSKFKGGNETRANPGPNSLNPINPSLNNLKSGMTSQIDLNQLIQSLK